MPDEATTTKMNRDEFYKELQGMVEGAVADAIGAGKEAGDKAIKDAGGQAEFMKMIALKMGGAQLPDSEIQQSKAARVGRVLRAFASAGTRPEQKDVLEIAKGYGAQELMFKGVGDDDFVKKTIEMSTFTTGGALLPQSFYAEVTEYLRARTVVRALANAPLALVNGSMTIPYIDDGSTVGYTYEGQAVAATGMTFGQLALEGKKQLAIVPISNDWLNSQGAGDVGGAALVGNDLARAYGVSEDAAMLRGTGTGKSIKGLRWQADSSNVVAQTKAASTVTVEEAGYDLVRLIYLQKAQDVPIIDGAYMFSPRTWLALMTGRDANSNLIWAPEMSTGTLFGQKFMDTTNVPDNLAGSTSEIIYATFDTVVIGDDMNMEVKLIEDAAYNNSAGTVVSGASQDQSIVRVKGKSDIGCRHRGKEVSVLTGVDWTRLA